MGKLKKWLIPVSLVFLLLATLVGCSSAPASLGETFDPSGNPFANRFSDEKDIRGPTYIIAASDSEHKYEADYRCSGDRVAGGDQVEINKAIEALIDSVTDEVFNSGALDVWVTLDNNRIQRGEVVTSDGITYTNGVDYNMDYSAGMIMCLSTGGMAGATNFYNDYEYGGGCVQLLDGTFWVDDSIRVRSHVQLTGGGYGSIIKLRDSEPDSVPLIYNYDVANGNDNISIRNMTLDGNWLMNAGTTQCVLFNLVSNSEVKDCFLMNSHNQGIYLYLCSKIVISGHVSIGITDYSVYVRDSTYCVVSDNVFEDNEEHAIYLYTATYCTVTGNIVNNGLWNGIFLTMNSDHNIISNNSILNSGQEGIGLNEADYNVISNNRVKQSGYSGIYLLTSHHNIISNNICSESSQDADNVLDNIKLSTSDYNLISGNICRQGALDNQSKYGIHIFNATSEKNIIQGNDLYDAGKTSNFLDAGTCTIVEDDNRDITPVQVKHMVYAQNTSGGNLLIGNVVSYEAAGAAVGFESPTAIGDPKVWGMLIENIDNNAYGYIQTLGGTVLLDATNVGGGAIVIGDLLCTEVGSRARKAAAASDHVAFAIAMEDLDAVDGVINALLITPRVVT